jgi:hypothetical protein
MGDFVVTQREANAAMNYSLRQQAECVAYFRTAGVKTEERDRRARIPEPDKFEGQDDECVETFIQRFIRYSNTQGVGGQHQAHLFVKLLGPGPRTSLEMMPDNDRNDLAALIEFLRQRYSADKSSFRNQTRYLQANQTSAQSIEGYLDHLIRLRYRGWPNETRGWDDSASFREHVQSRFVKGLMDPRLKEALQMTQLTMDWEDVSYTDFLTLLRRVQKGLRNRPQQSPAVVAYQSRDKTQVKCARCHRFGHYARECMVAPELLPPREVTEPGPVSRVEHMEQPAICGPPDSPPPSGVMEVYQQQVLAINNNNAQGAGCYHCKNPNHYYRDCPQNPNAYVTRGALKEELGPIREVCEYMGSVMKSGIAIQKQPKVPAQAVRALPASGPTPLAIMPSRCTNDLARDFPERMTMPGPQTHVSRPFEVKVEPEDPVDEGPFDDPRVGERGTPHVATPYAPRAEHQVSRMDPGN